MSNETIKREFPGKAVDMLSVCETIMAHALENLTFLSEKRTDWDEAYFTGILNEVQACYGKYLGINNAKELRSATKKVLALQKTALDDLAEFKVQVKEDFKKEKEVLEEMMKSLGFTQFHKAAQNHDQEGLIQLLYQFRDNMTEEHDP